MTKKNAKKTAARARQKALGGKYLSHLRIVDGNRDGARWSDLQSVLEREIQLLKNKKEDLK